MDNRGTSGEGSCNEPSSSATDQPPQPSVEGAGHNPQHPYAEGTIAAGSWAENPSDALGTEGNWLPSTLKRTTNSTQRGESKGRAKREHPPADCHKGKHRDTSDQAHKPRRIGGSPPQANAASETEQGAKQRRLAAPSHHVHAHDARTCGMTQLSNCIRQEPGRTQCNTPTPSHQNACSIDTDEETITQICKEYKVSSSCAISDFVSILRRFLWYF